MGGAALLAKALKQLSVGSRSCSFRPRPISEGPLSSPCRLPQAEDIKKVADNVSQLRRVGKGHGEAAPRKPGAAGAVGAADAVGHAVGLPGGRHVRCHAAAMPPLWPCSGCPSLQRFHTDPTRLPLHPCAPLTGVWAFDHELYEEEIRARATSA